MKKLTKSQRERLETLVVDCSTYRLSESESLEYIKQKLGRPISASHFYQIKHSLESDTEMQRWINDYARVGFLIEHRRRIDEMDSLQKFAYEMLLAERAKPVDQRDQSLILKIMAQMVSINKRLVSLQNGTPILTQVHDLLQSRQQIQQQRPTIIASSIANNGDGEGAILREEDQQQKIERLTAPIPDLQRRLEVQLALLKAEQEEDEKPADNDDNNNDNDDDQMD